jgi:hypothetical protein
VYIFNKSPILKLGATMGESPPVRYIILKPNEICPYKDECDFHRNVELEMCFGTIERVSSFVCRLDKLKLLYKSDGTKARDTLCTGRDL